MQDPSLTYTQIQPQFPEHEQLKCPRCESTNTKFCYYNNYNLSQPRHFCKNCRRYWTKGGALRNIPVGGGTRKNSKRSSNNPKPKMTPSSSSSSVPKVEQQSSVFNSSAAVDQDRRMLDVGGSFSSLLSGQFGNFLEGFDPHGSLGQFGGDPNVNSESEPGHHELMRGSQVELQQSGNSNSEGYLGDSSNWGGAGGGNGWPDLSIYTPGSNFQ